MAKVKTKKVGGLAATHCFKRDPNLVDPSSGQPTALTREIQRRIIGDSTSQSVHSAVKSYLGEVKKEHAAAKKLLDEHHSKVLKSNTPEFQAKSLQDRANAEKPDYLADIKAAGEQVNGHIPEGSEQFAVKADVQRIADKIREKDKITDVLRATILTADPSKAKAAIIAYMESQGYELYVKDDGKTDLEDLYQSEDPKGYKHVAMKFVKGQSDPLVKELLVITPAMFDAKMTLGHKFYDVTREIDGMVRKGFDEKDAIEISNFLKAASDDLYAKALDIDKQALTNSTSSLDSAPAAAKESTSLALGLESRSTSTKLFLNSLSAPALANFSNLISASETATSSFNSLMGKTPSADHSGNTSITESNSEINEKKEAENSSWWGGLKTGARKWYLESNRISAQPSVIWSKLSAEEKSAILELKEGKDEGSKQESSTGTHAGVQSEEQSGGQVGAALPDQRGNVPSNYGEQEQKIADATGKATGETLHLVKELSPEDQDVTRVATALTGKAPIFVEESDRFNGVYYQGRILLSKDNPNSMLTVLGHEVGHTLQWHPDYNGVVEKVMELADPEKRELYHDKLEDAHGKELPIDYVSKEILSDLIATRWHDKGFWAKLFSLSPKLGRAIGQAIDRLLGNGKKNGLDMTAMFPDMLAVQKIIDPFMQKALQENIERSIKKSESLSPETKFSADMENLIGVTPEALFSAAWHGSPHDHDNFSTEHIGTGEGNQAYGWGLYYAGSREVAEHYRDVLSRTEPSWTYTNNPVMNPRTGVWEYQAYQEGLRGGRAAFKTFEEAEKYADQKNKENTSGKLYKVELAPSEDEYLLWDKSLSEQSEKIKAALKGTPYEGDMQFDYITGESLYRNVSEHHGEKHKGRMADYIKPDDKAASEYLLSLGIRGIKYADGTSRGVSFQLEWADGKKGSYDVKRDAESAMLLMNENQAEAVSYLREKGKTESADALENGELVQRGQQFNYVIFNDQDVSIEAKFSVKEKPVAVKAMAKQFKENLGITNEEAIKEVDAYFEKLGEGYNTFAAQVESHSDMYPEMEVVPFPGNSDPTYKVTVDLVGACVRMLRAMAVHKYTRDTGKKLDTFQMRALETELNKSGFDLTCAYCYAFTRRTNAIKKLEQMTTALTEGEIPSYAKETQTDLWDAAISEAKANPGWKKDLASLPDLVAIKAPADSKTPKGTFIDRLRKVSPDAAKFRDKYPAIHALKQLVTDAGNMKMPTGTIAVAGQIVNMQQSMVEDLKKWGGLRWQSSIDFLPGMTYDYVQGVVEMAMRDLPGHTYTKEIDLALLLADSGFKVNLSAAPLVRNGKIEWEGEGENRRPKLDTSIGSMSWPDIERAMAAGPDHIGVMMLGINDEVLDWATGVGSKYAPYVIPWHSSGMPAAISKSFKNIIKATDYSDAHESLKVYDTRKDIPLKFRLIGIEQVDKKGEKTGKWVIDYTQVGKINPALTKYAEEYKQQQDDWRAASPKKHPTATLNGMNIPTGFIVDQTAGIDDVAATEQYFKVVNDLNLEPLFEEYRSRYEAKTGEHHGERYWALKKHYARTDTPLLAPDPKALAYDHAKKMDAEWAGSAMAKAVSSGDTGFIEAYRDRVLTPKEKKAIDAAVKVVMSNPQEPMEPVLGDIGPLMSVKDKLGPIPEVGININDSTQPFTDQILSGQKTIETRDSDSLRKYVGQQVGLIRTGKGNAQLVGYATIGEPTVYRSEQQFRDDQDKHLVPKDSKFDIKPNGIKYGYPLSDVVALPEPFDVGNTPMAGHNPYVARHIGTAIRERIKSEGTSKPPQFSIDSARERLAPKPEFSVGRPEPLQESPDSGRVATKEFGRIANDESLPRAVQDLVKNKDFFGKFGQSPDFGEASSPPSKGLAQDAYADIKRLSDIINSKAFLEHGFGGISVETQRSVVSAMVEIAHDDKILNSVISSVPADVMDNFTRGEISADVLFHNEPMLQHALSLETRHNVSIGASYTNSLIRMFALSAATEYSGLGSTDSRGVGLETFTTNRAVDVNHVITSYLSYLENKRSKTKSQHEPLFSVASSIPEETKAQAFQRTFQDKFNRVKTLQNWLEENGTQLSEQADVNRGLETMGGKIADGLSRLMDQEVNPLIEEAAKKKIKLSDVEKYLLAQHAAEANSAMAKLYNDPKATAFGMSDAEARTTLTDFRSRSDFSELKSLADRFQKLTTGTADLLTDSGIISDEMRGAWDASYSHYVPVRGGEDDTKPSTGKGQVIKRGLQRRAGHSLRDEHVIENIIKARESAIKIVERNKVNLQIAQLILEAKDDNIGTIGKPELRRVFKNKTAYTAEFKGTTIGVFNSESDADNFIAKHMAQFKTNIGDYVIDISRDPIVTMMVSPQLGPGEINAYVAGHQVRIQINDQVAAEALTNMGAEGLGRLLSVGKEINNWFSRAYTGYDPRFTIRNTLRDFTSGMVNLTGDYGLVTAGKIAANYPRAVKAFWQGRHDPTKNSWIDRYRKQGGSTGASYLSSLERLGDDVQSMYQEHLGAIETYNHVYAEQKALGKSDMMAKTKALARSGVSASKKVPILGHFLKIIEGMNSISENAFRVATFMTLVEQGKSEAEAGQAAKNSTINFDKKGELGAQMGALYLFFNPAVQGIQRSIFALTQSKHKGQAQALVGAMALAGLLAAEMARSAFGDDDEWKKVGRSIKNRNLVFRYGEKSFITIPLPYEYGSFVGIGYAMSDMLHGQFDQKSALNLASTIMDGLSPLGNPVTDEGLNEKSITQMLPTVAKLAIAPLTNLGSFGSNIAPTKFSETKPDSQNMFRGTKGSYYADVAQGLNEMTGGTKYSSGAVDVSPEVLKFYTRSILGGAFTFADQVKDFSKIVATGGTPEVAEVPMLAVLAKENTVKDSRREFWEIAKDAKKVTDEYNAAKKARDFETAKKIKEDNPELLRVAKIAEAQGKLAKAKRDATDAIRLDDSLSFAEKRERTKAIEEKEADIYDKLIKAFNH